MGQNGSCIQGVPDWVGPYEKYEKSDKHSSLSDEDRMLYDRVRELILLGSLTKDYSALEDFLSSNITDIHSKLKHGSSLYTSKQKEDLKAAKPLDVKGILTSSLHKESHCKSVNFSTGPNDCKPTNVKPVIVRKNCAVHGAEHKCTAHPQSQSSQNINHQPAGILINSPSRKGALMKMSTSRARGCPPKTVRFPPAVGSSMAPPPYRPTKLAETLVCKAPASGHQLISENVPRKDEKVTKVEENVVFQSSQAQQERNLAIDVPEITDDDSSCLSDDDASSESHWLKGLVSSTTEEQILPSDFLAAVEVQSAKDSIHRLEDRAETIVETFGVVLKHLEHGDWSTFCMSTSRLCDDIRKVLRDYNICSEATDPKEIKIRNHVIEALHQLTSHTLSLKEMSGEAQHQVLLPAFRVLGEVLHELMEFLISKELLTIVESIHNESSSHCVKMALCALAEMGSSGELMVELITQVDGIKSLLNFCLTGKWKQLQPLAIRTLTIMCAHTKAVNQLDMIGGFDFTVSSLLSNEMDESVQCEVAGLVAQVMKHWSKSNSIIKENIGGNMPQLVKALTELAKKTASSETFLLCAASLATLSSCSTEASSWLKVHEHDTRLFSASSKLESYV